MTEQAALEKLPLTPYGIQLTSVFVRKLRAERIATSAHWQPATRLEATEVNIDPLQRKAALTLDVQTGEAPEEIYVSLVAEFRYDTSFTEEQIGDILQHRVFNILLPFAREIIYALCIRMAITPIMLSMIGVEQKEE